MPHFYFDFIGGERPSNQQKTAYPDLEMAEQAAIEMLAEMIRLANPSEQIDTFIVSVQNEQRNPVLRISCKFQIEAVRLS